MPIHEICTMILSSHTSLGMESKAKVLNQIPKLKEHKVSLNLEWQTKTNIFYFSLMWFKNFFSGSSIQDKENF